MSQKFTELDFDGSKKNILEFLKTHKEFTDYDFTGSNLNILVDALAYTAAYIGTYANMSISEIFLGSSVLRNSVVSHAKPLSYMPRQINSASATISLTVPRPQGSTDNSLIIDRGTRLTSTLDGKSFDFVVADDSRMIYNATTKNFEIASVEIRQGSFQKQDWTYRSDSKDRYIITQPNVDVDFLKVIVQDSAASAVKNAWSQYDEITTIDRNTRAYFIQETEDSRVEIYFGDGIVGKRLLDGNIIQVELLATKGKEANGCNEFELVSDVRGISRSKFTVKSVAKANSGADAETIESIKFNAPQSFSAQNRAVTPNDYQAILSKKYGAIQTMNVWGGEENIPPVYGKVFVCIKPTFGLELSPAVKKRIKADILSKYKITGIEPDIVNADYTYVNVTSTLDVDMTKTTKVEGQIKTDVENEIKKYFTDTLNKFNTAFKNSNMTTRIDAVSPAVLSNRLSLTVAKKIVPLANTSRTYEFSYNNEVLPNTISCNEYSNDGGATKSQIKDDGKGIMLHFYNGVLVGEIGTIDYKSGNISLKSFIFHTPPNTTIEFTGTPKLNDVKSVRNNLVIVGNVEVDIPEVKVSQ